MTFEVISYVSIKLSDIILKDSLMYIFSAEKVLKESNHVNIVIMVQLSNDIMAQWLKGAKAQRFNGTIAQ